MTEAYDEIMAVTETTAEFSVIGFYDSLLYAPRRTFEPDNQLAVLKLPNTHIEFRIKDELDQGSYNASEELSIILTRAQARRLALWILGSEGLPPNG